MALAKEGDPLVSGSGEIILPKDTTEPELHEKRRVMPAIRTLHVPKKRTLDRLPEPEHDKQVVICAIVSMKLMGVDENDIADALGTTLDRVQSIVRAPATQATFEAMFQNMISTNSEAIQGRISSYANRAVDVVVELMEDADVRGDVRLKASQDILDRTGTNADQFFAAEQAQNQHDDELKIVFTNGEEEDASVTVEVKRK